MDTSFTYFFVTKVMKNDFLYRWLWLVDPHPTHKKSAAIMQTILANQP